MGSVASKTLAAHEAITQVLIADYNLEGAQELAATIGGGKVTAQFFNAEGSESIKEVVRGGAKSDIWCQIFADVLDRTIQRVENPIAANA